MDTKTIVKTFFFDAMANNGRLEGLGNRLMCPWRKSEHMTWLDVNQERYRQVLPRKDYVEQVLTIIMGITAFYLGWTTSEANPKEPLKNIFISTIRVLIIPHVIALFGTILKVISWFNKSVREKNFIYIRLKEKEQQFVPSFIIQSTHAKKIIDQKKVAIHPQDKVSLLPLVLKQKVFEFLLPSEINTIKMSSKTQLEDIDKSTDHINRTLIKQIFPASLLHRLGMEKIVKIMSEPSLKQRLDPTDLVPIDWRFDLRVMDGAPSENAKVWHFDPLEMEKKVIRWGKTKAGDVYLAFSYKFHKAPEAGGGIVGGRQFTLAGPHGLSILTFKKNSPTIILTPAIEKWEPRYTGELFPKLYEKINCFIVNARVLAIEDYLPRLLNGEPCGECRKNQNGILEEGSRMAENHSMVELFPLN